MARYTAIADVGNSLLKLLRENIASELIEKPEMIGLCSPKEMGDFKLVLYLFHMEECRDLRYGGMTRTPQGPLVLDLYYLFAANSTAEIQSKALDENMIIGNVVQILHDYSVLSGSDLEGSLAENNDVINISFINPEINTSSAKVKESSDLIFKNAVCYKVGPVYIDSNNIRASGPRVL